MSENLKKMISYYKPYLGTFILDMILAMMSAAVALVIPLCDFHIDLFKAAGDIRTDPVDRCYAVCTCSDRLLQPFFYCKPGACDGR